MRLSLALIVLLVLGWLTSIAAGQGNNKKASQPKAAPAKPIDAAKGDRRLSLDQIRQLVRARTPDNIIAQEIQSRGLRADLVRGDIDQLRQEGAGPETALELQRQLPVSGLTITTDAGALVKLDAGSAIQVGPTGVVTLSGLEPGQHQLSIEKPLYKPIRQTVSLKARENAPIQLNLEWAVGFLTITPNIPDARIQVAGGPAQVGHISRMVVPVGQVSISVSAALRRTVSENVSIEAGKELTLAIPLDWDDNAMASLANQITSLFQAKQYQSALDLAARYFQSPGRDKDVLGVVALSNLELDRFADFKSSAKLALDAGSTLRFALQHVHGGLTGSSLHPAVLELTAQVLRFRPESKCNFEPFEVSLGQVSIGKRSSVYLGNKQSAWSINVSVPNPSNPKKEAELNFATLRNRLDVIEAIREVLTTTR